MAYQPIPVGGAKNVQRRLYTVPALTGGCGTKNSARDDQAVLLENVFCEDGMLRLRGGISRVAASDGTFHSMLREPFGKNILLHIGDRLLRFDGTVTVTLAQNVPDDRSFFFTMNAHAYLFSSRNKIYEIDELFACTEKEPYCPVILEHADRDLSSYETREAVNMLGRRVKCSYNVSDRIAGTMFRTPYDIDSDAPVEIFLDGKKPSVVWASRAEEKTIIVNGNDTGIEQPKEVTFAFTIAGEDETFSTYFSKIYGCTLAVCYGGTTKDGTRAFATGNGAYPGMYFRSELKNPLYFPDLAQETLGSGSEQVTGVEKRYEKLYFFTERSIYAMSYSFSVDEGPVFTVSEISTNVGCTLPGSVCAVDNTLVFADADTGVHLLQSTEIFDELNVRRISGNLSAGGTSFASLLSQEEAFPSCDFERKYYLYTGKKLCIWDYGSTPYYDGGDLKKAEERLSWYLFSGFDGCKAIFSLKGQLYFALNDAASDLRVALCLYDPESGGDSALVPTPEGTQTDLLPFEGAFMTREFDFGSPVETKLLLEFSFDCEKQNADGSLQAAFFGDGGTHPYYTFSPPLEKARGRVRLRLPACYAHTFAVKFTFRGGAVGVSRLAFLWYGTDREKYDR